LIASGKAAWDTRVAEKYRGQPVFRFIEDDPNLPRVLLIGDSISVGYTEPVRKILAGKANVHRIPDNAQTSTKGVEQLDAWLEGGNWKVVHFNFGLHDISRKIDGGADLRGDPTTPIGIYQSNLEIMLDTLKGTGAGLIWASTTPVPTGNTAGRREGDEKRYNDVARGIMSEHGITINDLYGLLWGRLHEVQLPANVHFTAEGSRVLGERVAAAIEAALDA
jgi:acyl-CoA thioesterase-1